MESEIWHPPAGSVALWVRVQKRDNGLCLSFCWEKSFPQLLPWFQIPPLPAECHWHPLSCHHSAGDQREWVWVSLCVGSLKGTAWDSAVSYTNSVPDGFCSQKLRELIFLELVPWIVGPVWGWDWLLSPQISLLNFYLPHMDVGPTHSTSLPLPPVWMDMVSLIRLPFSLIFDGCEWWLFYNLVVNLIWLCGEAAMFTYAAVLTKSKKKIVFLKEITY